MLRPIAPLVPIAVDGASTGHAPAEGVGHHQGENQQDPLDEVLGVVRDIEHREAVEENADEEGADERAKRVGSVGAEYGEADQRCRHGLQQVGVAGADVAAPRRADKRMPPIAANNTGDDVGQRSVALDGTPASRAAAEFPPIADRARPQRVCVKKA